MCNLTTLQGWIVNYYRRTAQELHNARTGPYVEPMSLGFEESVKMSYQDHIIAMGQLVDSKHGAWTGIDAEAVARMRLQNRFKTGLEIARYTADIMRRDMAAYDADPA